MLHLRGRFRKETVWGSNPGEMFFSSWFLFSSLLIFFLLLFPRFILCQTFLFRVFNKRDRRNNNKQQKKNFSGSRSLMSSPVVKALALLRCAQSQGKKYFL